MKKGWRVERLGDVCEIFAGGDVPKDRFSKAPTDKYTIPIFSNGEKDNGLYGYTNIARVTFPSITISARGTIGYSAKREEEYYPAIRLVVVIPNKEVLNLSFLHYAIQNIDFGHSGTSIPQLTVPMVREYSIPLPPLPEQERIVSLLDESFAALAQVHANAARNLVNAREVFEAELNVIFENGKDWKRKKFGELFSFKNGINFDKTQKTGDGILTVDVLNMYNEGTQVDLTQLYRVNKEVSGEYILKNGDILIVRSSVKKEGVAWATFFKETNEPITFCGFIIRGRPIKEINPEYIVYFLRSPITREQLIKTATQSTITNINQQNLSQLIVPLPPLAEQRAIVQRLDGLAGETRRLEEVYRQKVEAVEELRKSILKEQLSMDN